MLWFLIGWSLGIILVVGFALLVFAAEESRREDALEAKLGRGEPK